MIAVLLTDRQGIYCVHAKSHPYCPPSSGGVGQEWLTAQTAVGQEAHHLGPKHSILFAVQGLLLWRT